MHKGTQQAGSVRLDKETKVEAFLDDNRKPGLRLVQENEVTTLVFTGVSH